MRSSGLGEHTTMTRRLKLPALVATLAFALPAAGCDDKKGDDKKEEAKKGDAKKADAKAGDKKADEKKADEKAGDKKEGGW